MKKKKINPNKIKVLITIGEMRTYKSMVMYINKNGGFSLRPRTAIDVFND
jgi:hypothetical protein